MIVVLFGAIMSLAHYFSDRIVHKFKKHGDKIVSLSAGISVTYIFLNLFPEFSYGASQIGGFLFFFLLFGFVLFHIIEKYIYQHEYGHKRLRVLAIEDSTISFFYHFIIGMVMVNFFNRGFYDGILFFIPVFLHTASNILPLDRTESNTIKVVLALSTLLGVLFALFVYPIVDPVINLSLLGFIIGGLSFTVIRHSIPQGNKGRPLFFIIGVIVYSIILFLL